MQYRPIEFYYWAVPLAVLVAVALLYGLKHLILGRFVGDLPRVCRRCKYDLAGLAVAALCPECGRDLGERRAVRCGRRERDLVRYLPALGVAIAIGVIGYRTENHIRASMYGELHFVSEARLARSIALHNNLSRRLFATRLLHGRVLQDTISDNALRRCIDGMLDDLRRGAGHHDSIFGVSVSIRTPLDKAHERGLITEAETDRIAALTTAFRCKISISRRDAKGGPWAIIEWRAYCWAPSEHRDAAIFSLEVLDSHGQPMAPITPQMIAHGADFVFQSSGIWHFNSPNPGDTMTIRWRMVLHHPVTGEPNGVWEQEHLVSYGDPVQSLDFRPHQVPQPIQDLRGFAPMPR